MVEHSWVVPYALTRHRIFVSQRTHVLREALSPGRRRNRHLRSPEFAFAGVPRQVAEGLAVSANRLDRFKNVWPYIRQPVVRSNDETEVLDFAEVSGLKGSTGRK